MSAENALFKIKSGLQANLNALIDDNRIEVGTCYVTTDNNKLHIGTSQEAVLTINNGCVNAEPIDGTVTENNTLVVFEAEDSKKLNGKDASYYASATALESYRDETRGKITTIDSSINAINDEITQLNNSNIVYENNVLKIQNSPIYPYVKLDQIKLNNGNQWEPANAGKGLELQNNTLNITLGNGLKFDDDGKITLSLGEGLSLNEEGKIIVSYQSAVGVEF